jgi:hypothetical protein
VGGQLARLQQRRLGELLLLSDNRAICTPLFSGVLWDLQDYCWRMSSASK